MSAALLSVVETVRRMPPGRLRSAGRVDAARALARALAATVQGIEQARSPERPAWRDLPDVPDLVVGDQLAVLARDLQLAVAAGPPAEVWTPAGRAPFSAVLAELRAKIAETNRAL
ncbi:MAG TPA: hypothetical protein VHD87_13090 [Acidimicrobiales bacterium]|nr:hypothetical protein [Acidimicrobiales bacterium]